MSWYAKSTGGYVDTDIEAQGNADMIAGILAEDGWSINAICAVLGNAHHESNLNPWRWQGDDVLASTDPEVSISSGHAYGLFQFDPASKYVNGGSQFAGYAPNFSDRTGQASDGEAQVRYLLSTIESSWGGGLHDYYYDDFMAIGVDIDEFYYLSFNEFKTSQLAPSLLTGAFELKYERPQDTYGASSYADRSSSANYWYEYFEHHPPTPPTPTQKQHHFKFYLYGGTRRGY